MVMQLTNLFVPTIRDRTVANFGKLFQIHQHVNSNVGPDDRLRVDFSRCTFIPQNGVAFLGGLITLARTNGADVQVDWTTLSPEIRKHLANCGFIAAMGGPDDGYVKNTVPYRGDMVLNKDSLMEYLTQDWLGRGWIGVSSRLRDAVVGKTFELYANAFEHGSSPVGVHSCGQFYYNNGELRLAVVDFGVGIVANVRRFLDDSSISDSDALQWAFQEGNSTILDGIIGRGMGLDILRRFVHVNQGVIMIFSNRSCGIITADSESFGTMPYECPGTVVNIGFKCDERFYKLAAEDDEEPLF